jgi:hypothetical protein
LDSTHPDRSAATTAAAEANHPPTRIPPDSAMRQEHAARERKNDHNPTRRAAQAAKQPRHRPSPATDKSAPDQTIRVMKKTEMCTQYLIILRVIGRSSFIVIRSS